MMNNNERHAWSFPTVDGLARGIGMRSLEEEAREGLVTGAMRAFTDAIKRKTGSLTGSDFAMEVAQSKGDVTRVPGYKEMADALRWLQAIDVSAGKNGLGAPLQTAKDAHHLLLSNKKAFQDSFRGQAATGRYVYIGAVLALYGTVSLIIAECIDFEQVRGGTFEPVVKRPAVDNVMGSLPVTRLERFVARASKANFAQSLNETAPLIEQEVLTEMGVGLPAFMAGAAIVTFLLWFARDMTAWFFAVRKRFSVWLELQARFLELNAARLSGARNAAAVQKQLEYATTFRSLADKVRVENAAGTREAEAEISDQNLDIQRVSDGGGSGGALI